MSLNRDIKKYPLASIVIPTYNSEKTLDKCLESIKNQTYKNVEVIVVDKSSEDNTAKIAKVYTDKVFVINAKERSEQRNFGAKKANGKYLLFIDSDMILTPVVVEECVKKQLETDCSGIIIPEKTVGNNFLAKVRTYERKFYIGEDLVEAARFFVKDNFLKIGGYDENITGEEDWELPIRMKKSGYNVTERINSFILHDESGLSLIRHLKKKYYYATTIKVYINKHPDYAHRQYNPLYRFGLFFKNKEFYSKPLLALGVLILKSLEYASAGSGYLVGKVRK